MTRITVRSTARETPPKSKPRMLRVHHLRETLGRTATVVGCDTSNCGTSNRGACTVHLDGRSVTSWQRSRGPGRRASGDRGGGMVNPWN